MANATPYGERVSPAKTLRVGCACPLRLRQLPDATCSTWGTSVGVPWTVQTAVPPLETGVRLQDRSST
ncbi:hypothetical protein SD81_020385 [Tolypothrix campylonemoides VB511288]|nr:hypothetical protein SD81_020385 [Tolypothrix campylonemoides VB511288]